ncbi:filamentous hemagglutinin N-terminal domain-containing protein [Selenomonas sp. oral taxon 138]|uniref:filamentous hemagglutinin N-terminal domain-containing protein n=1 Tax=Selenomonas sp. oral taxon 138 TaxID=712532 RepID=UPI0002A2ADF7|nr:filamentous hemagglutinin N-terminal domain-containing protein [Selenomonas sp. oral taxon 138]EKX98123.1 filamentous hemagglutinin family domain protein [Selenomonas sp. oral taxon 138 str. F0429]
MNLRKKMRRSSLAALITLALTSSALAMPTGGEVVGGNPDITLSGGTWDAVANNATITATNDGQINWQAFNIANGETLTFNIASNKTLVNNVTGSQLSDILGTMNQTGGGDLVLVNPNGIHIGGNAVLNVSDMTLSALGIVKANNTERVLRQNGEAPITIDGNAEFNVSNQLDIFGGKVSVADGVVFNMGVVGGTNEPMLQIKAANSAAWTLKDGEDLTEELVHNAGNDVVFNGKVNMLGGNRRETEIGGATVSATGAKFLGEEAETTIYAASKFNADERDTDDAKDVFTADVTAANKVSLDGVTAEGKSLQLGGGVIDVKNSTADVYRLGMEAVASYRSTGNGAVMDDKSAPDRTINIVNSMLTTNQGTIYGGKITVADDATIRMESDAGHEAEVIMIAGNRFKRQHGDDHGNELLTYRGTRGNDLTFHGMVKHETDGKASFGVVGYTVNADRAKLHGTRTEFSLSAFSKFDYDQTATDWRSYWGKAETSAANTLQADGLDVHTKREFYADGGSVSLKNSTIATGGFNLYAFTQDRDDGDTDVGNRAHEHKTAGVDNVVHLKNVTVTHPTGVDYDGTRIFGGKVTIEDSNLGANSWTDLYAGSSFDRVYSGRGDQEVKVTVTKDNELGLWKSEVAAYNLNLGAGKIGVWKESAITATSELNVNPAAIVTRTDSSAASLLRDASSHVKLAGTESTEFIEQGADKPAPPVPQPPAPPVNPETPTLSEDDQANIAEGNAKAQIALTEATQEARSEVLTETIAKLNENAATSRRQTAGVVVGVVQAIAESSTLTDAEKTELQVAVLNAYAPVQEAKAGQDNTVSSAVDEAVSAVVTASATPVYPDETEAEDVVSFA